jgi:hypothetical protein
VIGDLLIRRTPLRRDCSHYADRNHERGNHETHTLVFRRHHQLRLDRIQRFSQTTANGPYYATPSWDQQLPAATRFIVLANWNNEAVLDRETGLVWERSPTVRTFTVSWSEALSVCFQLNAGGRTGWRLPTVPELMSLIDRSVPIVTLQARLPVGHPFNVDSRTFWAATIDVDDPNNAWAVPMSDGSPFKRFKNFEVFGWCVRGGEGVGAPIY